MAKADVLSISLLKLTLTGGNIQLSIAQISLMSWLGSSVRLFNYSAAVVAKMTAWHLVVWHIAISRVWF